MLAPVIELFGYIITGAGLVSGVLDVKFAVLFLAVALGYQMMLSIWAVILEEATFRVYDRRQDFYRLLIYALVEPFGYRRLTVLWRLRGVFNALRGLTDWGEMQRQGFGGKSTGAVAPGAGEAVEAPGAAEAMEPPGAADAAA